MFDSGLFIDTQSYFRKEMYFDWNEPPFTSRYFNDEISMPFAAQCDRAVVFTQERYERQRATLSLFRDRMRKNFTDCRTDRLAGLSCGRITAYTEAINLLSRIVESDAK